MSLLLSGGVRPERAAPDDQKIQRERLWKKAKEGGWGQVANDKQDKTQLSFPLRPGSISSPVLRIGGL